LLGLAVFFNYTPQFCSSLLITIIITSTDKLNILSGHIKMKGRYFTKLNR